MNDILRLERVSYTYRGSHAPAVAELDMRVPAGASVGIVGESGSGKSTTLSLLLALSAPTSGRVLFEGEPLNLRDRRQLRRLRRNVQPVYQDPYASLDPRMRVDRIVAEPLGSLDIEKDPAARRLRVEQALADVGLGADALLRFPHEFSGGQRQRVGIARALAVEPDFIVADECVSALDVSIRKDVLELLKDLRTRLGLTFLFISHDLAVVEDISDRVAVMYKGDIVEVSSAHSIYRDPQDDYTKALLAAVPIPDPTIKRERVEWDAQAYMRQREARIAAGD